MSNLRKHLQAEKNAYNDARYPGDLGELILPKRVLHYRKTERLRSPFLTFFGLGVAAAAMIFVAIPIWHKLTAPAPQVAQQPTEEKEDEMPLAMTETETMPD